MALDEAVVSDDLLLIGHRSDETIRLTVAQAIVRYLVRQYSVRDGRRQRLIPGLYGIFGHGNIGGLGQAMADCAPNELFFLEGRNEQAMAHAAAGYARASRRLSTLACASSIGPGALNMIPAVAGAHVNRLPILVLPGDEYAGRRQGTILQGLEHPRAGDTTVNDCFRPVSRYFDRITRPEQLLTALPSAMRVLTSPEDTGPVVLCLPQDVQTEAFEFPVEFFDERDWLVDRPIPDPVSLDEAARVLMAARRPLIIAGGGVYYSEAEEALRAFARELAIPVAETYSGKGVLGEDSWRNLGGLGVEGTTPANAIARDADVVVCAGTRLSDFVTGAQSVFQCAEVRFIGLNIARLDARKQGAISVVGDLRVALDQLRSRIPGRVGGNEYQEATASHVEAWRQSVDDFVSQPSQDRMSQLHLIRILNQEAPEGSTVVAAAGTLPGEVLKIWDTSNATTCHLEFGFSCMGYEIPGSIGAKLARPDQHVFGLVGDGTFLLNPTEIVTAVQNGLNVTYIISANDGMHSIRRLEEAMVHEPFANLFVRRDMHTRQCSSEPIGLDLAAVARGLGAVAVVASTEDQVRRAIRDSLRDPQPHVVIVPTDPQLYIGRDEVWHDVAPAETSAHPAIAREREVYEEIRRARQRRFL